MNRNALNLLMIVLHAPVPERALMRVPLLGGTGSIGAPLTRELIRAGHDVVALARSDAAARALTGFGALPVAGDISTPQQWRNALPSLDCVIHAAATFSDQELD
jgi:uncharacterized protein YbjT (DUF2867 family)